MTHHKSQFTSLLWNANGILSRRQELIHLLTDRDIDSALITETHLNDTHTFTVSGYTCYRADHPSESKNGSLILIKNSLSYFQHSSISTNCMQSASISISFSSFKILLSAVYCSPNVTIHHPEFLSLFKSLGPRFLTGGDFNAKHPRWGSRLTNPRGRILYDILQSQKYDVISPNSPTYWPTDPSRIPDLVDFFITSGLRGISYSVETLFDLSSDHTPILLTLNKSPQPRTSNPTLTPGPINWKSFQFNVEQSIDLTIPLKTPKDVDEAVQMFTKAIQDSALNSCQPKKRLSFRPPPQLPDHILNLLSAKRRARALWQRTRYPSHHKSFNKLTRLLKSALSEFRSESYNDYLKSLSTEDQSLWAATRKILRFHPVPSPLRRDDGSWARSDEERATLFSSHLETTFTPHPTSNPEYDLSVLSILDSPLPLSLPPKAFNPSDVKYIIKHLPRKSPGPDLITSTILKNLPNKAIIFLTYIYNSILRTTHFPNPWKHSVIVLIHKPHKPPLSPSSYRPISLLSIMSKIFEKLLYKRILPYIDSSNSIPNHQFGFRSHHSTIQQCFRVVDAISSSLESKSYCTSAFLDIAQAFDRVWHPGLLYKVKPILPHTYYLILKSYLSNRSFQVRSGSALSPTHPAISGVPQGSILGPLLFLLYTADFPTHPDTLTTIFADDTGVLSISPDPQIASQQLQEHLQAIELWCSNWRIKINPNKCSHVTFTLNRRTCPPVYIQNIPLPASNEVRYLGLYLDSRLTWNPHTRLKRTELNRKYGLLRRLLGPSSKLSLQNKLTIYKTILRPTWTYGLELWGTTKPSNLHRIQAFQSKVLRKITNAPFYVSNKTLHTDLNIPFVQDLAKSRFQNFHTKLSIHPNPEALSLSTPSHPANPPRRLKRLWPRDLLQL